LQTFTLLLKSREKFTGGEMWNEIVVIISQIEINILKIEQKLK
jgi:hypothetical protein